MKKENFDYESIARKIIDNKKITQEEFLYFQVVNKIVLIQIFKKFKSWGVLKSSLDNTISKNKK